MEIVPVKAPVSIGPGSVCNLPVPLVIHEGLVASKLFHVVSNHHIAIHGHQGGHIFIEAGREDVGSGIVMSSGEAHDAHEGIIEHIVGERHISSFQHGLHFHRMGSPVGIGCVNPERNMDHGVVELVRIVSRSFRHLFPVVREIEHTVSVEPIGGLVHNIFHHVIIEKDRIIILIIHDFRSTSCISGIPGPMVEFRRIPIPVAYMAAHEVHHNQLAAVIGIHFPKVGNEGGVIILGHHVGAYVGIDPVLVITGRTDGANRRIPDAETGLVGNPGGLKACLPCQVDNGIGFCQIHVIVLVLFRQRFRQHLHRLGIAGIAVIEEHIMRIGCRFRLEGRSLSGITVHIHMVPGQGFPDYEHIDPVRCRLQLPHDIFVCNMHMTPCIHHFLEIRKAMQGFIGFIIHMGQSGAADGKGAESHIHKEKEEHAKPGLSGHLLPVEAETACFENEPAQNEKRCHTGCDFRIGNIHLNILHGFRQIRLGQSQQHINGNEGMGNHIIANVGKLHQDIKDNQHHAGYAGNHPRLPRQNPGRRQAGHKEVERCGKLAAHIGHIQKHLRLGRQIRHDKGQKPQEANGQPEMDGSPLQMMADEVGRHKSHLQEEKKYLHLGKRFIPAGSAKIPGQEESQTERNQRGSRPPPFPVAGTFLLQRRRNMALPVFFFHMVFRLPSLSFGTALCMIHGFYTFFIYKKFLQNETVITDLFYHRMDSKGRRRRKG